MDPEENALLAKLRVSFRDEAPKKLMLVRRRLYESCKENSSEAKQDLLREVHNITGISRISALPAIQLLCEVIERVLRSNEFPPPKNVYDQLMEALQLVEELIPLDEAPGDLSADMRGQLDKLVLAPANQE